MEVDLDNESKQLPPWDYAVKIGGVRYATRQPTLAEDETIMVLHTMKKSECFEFIHSLFAEPKPPKTVVTQDMLVSMIVNLVSYDHQRRMPFFNAATEHVMKKIKNAATIANAVRAGMPSPMN